MGIRSVSMGFYERFHVHLRGCHISKLHVKLEEEREGIRFMATKRG
jgi:hypothetical protein